MVGTSLLILFTDNKINTSGFDTFTFLKWHLTRCDCWQLVEEYYLRGSHTPPKRSDFQRLAVHNVSIPPTGHLVANTI